jgi:hypothetical protein
MNQRPPWAVFGPPQPAPTKPSQRLQKQNKNQSTWQEPFHPEFEGFDAPPFYSRQPKK